MPSWGESRTDAQLWDLVAFLGVLPRLSAADFRKIDPAATASGVAQGVAPTGGQPRFIPPK